MDQKSSPELIRSVSAAIKCMKASKPEEAEQICREWLSMNPSCTDHLRILSHSLMKQERLQEAEEQIRFALSLEPEFPQLEEDLGSVLALQKKFADAIPHFEKAIQQEPRLPTPYKKLAQAYIEVGRGKEADDLFRLFLERDPGKKAVADAMIKIQEGNSDEGVDMLRKVLKVQPDNIDAMRYLAAAYLKSKKHVADAEALLRRAHKLAPDYTAVLMLLGTALLERHKFKDAATSFNKLIKLQPNNDAAWASLGHAFARSDNTEEAAEAYAKALELNPDVAMVQMSQGHILKTLGDQDKALEHYRHAIRLKPDFGEVYWSMANLKIFKFEDAEVEAMEEHLKHPNLTESREAHFCFALGKAYEDKKDYDKAWHYYDSGNKKQRGLVQHDPMEVEMQQDRIIDVFTEDFLRANEGHGCKAPDPIFIIGLPRSGSTLVEQILASHSQVEGTAELPFLGKMASSIGKYRPDGVRFPMSVRDLRRQDWDAYGKQYLEDSSPHRHAKTPYFTDKLPNNFPFVGLVHLILPNAKIINARRHPIDCCLGNYKQLWGKGQHFTYDMLELADYYKQYHKIMKHWHQVLPGKVLDVHYEDTVMDLESQVRKILDYCGLPFEEQCLRFYETDRAIRTASSEQVRQPIYKAALGRWRRYEKHLDHWIEELTPIVNELPESVRNVGQQ
jgi:tetratricopeptide (TPR) repeat protein